MKSIVRNPILLVRLIPGIVFFLEGIQKFVYPDSLAVGRFLRIGIPYASFWGPFVGVVEIFCGLLIIFGLFSRLATIPLLIDMLIAFIYTKWPVLVEKGFLPMFHEWRTDYAMILSLIYLFIVGSGNYSLDKILFKKKTIYNYKDIPDS